MQGSLPVAEATGLLYRPEFLSADEERELLALLDALEFHEIVMRGQTARRTARHFGYSYDYDTGRPKPGEPLPEWLAALRTRAARAAGVEPAELVEALVQRYPPGAPIGWHRDAPAFGKVIGISLHSSARMRFRRMDESFELTVEPRSLYVLAGAARWSWQHSIPPTNDLRYSITFRTLRGGVG